MYLFIIYLVSSRRVFETPFSWIVTVLDGSRFLCVSWHLVCFIILIANIYPACTVL